METNENKPGPEHELVKKCGVSCACEKTCALIDLCCNGCNCEEGCKVDDRFFEEQMLYLAYRDNMMKAKAKEMAQREAEAATKVVVEPKEPVPPEPPKVIKEQTKWQQFRRKLWFEFLKLLLWILNLGKEKTGQK